MHAVDYRLTHSGVCRDCDEWVCDGWCPYGMTNLARKKWITEVESEIGDQLSRPAGTALRGGEEEEG